MKPRTIGQSIAATGAGPNRGTRCLETIDS